MTGFSGCSFSDLQLFNVLNHADAICDAAGVQIGFIFSYLKPLKFYVFV